MQALLDDQNIPQGFCNHTLPHFTKFTVRLETVGLAQRSFFEGLSPSEFFFHAIFSLDAKLASDNRTQDIGCIMHRVVRMMEGLCVKYDQTVHNSFGEVVQFVYGEDGRDAAHMRTTSTSLSSYVNRFEAEKLCHWHWGLLLLSSVLMDCVIVDYSDLMTNTTRGRNKIAERPETFAQVNQYPLTSGSSN
jgi:hypothetical protein